MELGEIADLDYRLLESLGVAYNYTPPEGTTVEIIGLFYDPNEPTGAADIQFAGSGPQLLVFRGTRSEHEFAVEELHKDATVVRKDGTGETYKVKNWNRDELSLAVLKLRTVTV